jgi:hypothetical protein
MSGLRAKAHLQLLGSGVVTWLGFFVIGLPDYYQQYSTLLVAIGTALLVPPTIWLGWRVISRQKPERALPMALALSFYFTVPFAALDTAYCGVWLGHGHRYLVQYWYLTVFYVIPWVVYVPMGLTLRKRAAS